MKKSLVKMVSMLLAVSLLLSACGPGTVESDTPVVDNTGAPVETENGGETGPRLQPEWTKDAVIYEVNIRQYTEEGTFNAFAEHLQEIWDTGCNVLWFMPIHPISVKNRSGKLGSYYSVADYCRVNPEFGTEEDFAALVEKAHDMGFHVMLDWVANHTGWDNPWITEHPDWYTQDKNGNIISPDGMGWPDVADLNYDNAEMRQAMIDSMKYWVETYDIDGFRCDYANGAPVGFWEDARAQLDAVKPVYMLAECDGIKELLSSAFDMDYNWHLWDTLTGIATGAGKASSIKIYLDKGYPDGTYTLNFLDNHDKNSYEGTIRSHFSEETLPLMFALIYTIPGVPLIYTGDEIGLDHALEFMDRDPVDWDSSDTSYRELLAALSTIRSGNPALYAGNYGGAIEYFNVGDSNNYIFTFAREKDGNRIKAIFNTTRKEREVDLSEWLTGSETVLMHGVGAEVNMEEYPIADDGLTASTTLAPWEFYIVRE
ncbi:MAG: alpha-amylase [Clostridiales bacterium]|nr:alpha-amylase [Clostridiales bacterium]